MKALQNLESNAHHIVLSQPCEMTNLNEAMINIGSRMPFKRAHITWYTKYRCVKSQDAHTPIICAWVFDESASKMEVKRAPYRAEATVQNKSKDGTKRHVLNVPHLVRVMISSLT